MDLLVFVFHGHNRLATWRLFMRHLLLLDWAVLDRLRFSGFILVLDIGICLLRSGSEADGGYSDALMVLRSSFQVFIDRWRSLSRVEVYRHYDLSVYSLV